MLKFLREKEGERWREFELAAAIREASAVLGRAASRLLTILRSKWVIRTSDILGRENGQLCAADLSAFPDDAIVGPDPPSNVGKRGVAGYRPDRRYDEFHQPEQQPRPCR